MAPEALVNVLEAAMLAAGRALTLDDFLALFIGNPDAPSRSELRKALAQLGENLEDRGIELVEVASGWRLQVREAYSPWLGGLFAERPPRYSRALLETLALMAYRQPITRGEIEEVRGVAVSSNIIKTLMEREWIRVLGHREVPGRPALYGTTREFLDHFGLKSLEGLPPLAEIRDLDQIEPDLFAPAPAQQSAADGEGEGDGAADVNAPTAGDDTAGVDGQAGAGAQAQAHNEGAGDGAERASSDDIDDEGPDPEQAVAGDESGGEVREKSAHPDPGTDTDTPADSDDESQTDTGLALEIGGGEEPAQHGESRDASNRGDSVERT